MKADLAAMRFSASWRRCWSGVVDPGTGGGGGGDGCSFGSEGLIEQGYCEITLDSTRRHPDLPGVP